MDTIPVNKSSQLIDVRQKAPQLDTSGAGSALGAFMSMVNMIQQSKTNSDNVKNQFELLNREQRFQREMNENLYKTYRRSLEGAGFNVNSALGGFPNTGSPSVSPTTQSAPQFDLGVASLLQQQPIVDAQARLLNAQTENTKAQTSNVESDTGLKEAQRWAINQLTPSQVDNLQTATAKLYRDISLIDANEQEVLAKVKLINEQIHSAEIENFIAEQTKDVQVLRIAQLFNNEYLAGKKTAAEISQAYKTIQVMNATIKNLKAQARLFNAQASTEEKLSDKKLIHLTNLIRNLAITGDKQEFDLQLDKDFSEKQRELILKNMEYEGNLLDMKSDILPLSALFEGVGAINSTPWHK